MAAQDLSAFLFIGAIGVTCGLISAFVFRRFPRPFVWTLIVSPLVATVGCMAVLGIWEVVRAIDGGHPLGFAIHAGIGAAILIAFAAPFVSGPPAVLVGLALQLLL
ncbi:MAG TPA: hypothetical protein VN048_14755, partial [Verrucomicrobiae bacterium]|nr:hypothetical protein [Verrucomicrobiae bacterium]